MNGTGDGISDSEDLESPPKGPEFQACKTAEETGTTFLEPVDECFYDFFFTGLESDTSPLPAEITEGMGEDAVCSPRFVSGTLPLQAEIIEDMGEYDVLLEHVSKVLSHRGPTDTAFTSTSKILVACNLEAKRRVEKKLFPYREEIARLGKPFTRPGAPSFLGLCLWYASCLSEAEVGSFVFKMLNRVVTEELAKPPPQIGLNATPDLVVRNDKKATFG